MLDNDDFNLSPQTLFEFKDSLRNLVNELNENDGLYSQLLGEYLNELGEILFIEEEDPDVLEAKIIRFMAVVSEYRLNEEFLVDDLELE